MVPRGLRQRPRRLPAHAGLPDSLIPIETTSCSSHDLIELTFAHAHSANKCAVTLRDFHFTLKIRMEPGEPVIVVSDRPPHIQRLGRGMYPHCQTRQREGRCQQ